MKTSVMHAFCSLTFRTLNIDLIPYRWSRQEIWVQDYCQCTYSISDVLTLANIVGSLNHPTTTATAIRTSEKKKQQQQLLNRAEQQLPCFHAFWYISLPLLPRLLREIFSLYFLYAQDKGLYFPFLFFRFPFFGHGCFKNSTQRESAQM